MTGEVGSALGFGVSGCAVRAQGIRFIRVSNIRRLMSTGLPLQPRESKGQLQRVTHLTKPASCTESSSGETSLLDGESEDEVIHRTHGQRSSNSCQRFRWLQGMGFLPGGSQGPTTHTSIRAGKVQCPYIQQEEKAVFFNSKSHLICFRGLL